MKLFNTIKDIFSSKEKTRYLDFFVPEAMKGGGNAAGKACLLVGDRIDLEIL